MAQARTANRAQLGPSQALFDGVYCSISANNNRDVILTYHKNLIDDMYYRLGKVNKENVLQAEEERELPDCNGSDPQVALNNNRIMVVAFTSSALFRENTIKCVVGCFKHKERPANWEPPKEACRGDNPSIAISGDTVILVYCSKSSDVMYNLGQIDSSSMAITWTAQGSLVSYASYPSVAMNNRAFVVLYKDTSGSRLKTVVGEVKANAVMHGEVQDDSERKPDPKDHFEGSYPSIAMFNDHSIIAIHQRGEAAFRKLFARSGTVNTIKKSIEWNEARSGCFVPGALSSVTAMDNNEKEFVEVHSTNRLGGCTLWYEVGSIK